MNMTESKTSRVIFSLLFLLMISARAQAERLPIKTYTAADGLPRDHINRIVPDSKGFLWLCTSEGLSRFDGYGFVNYSREQGLPNQYIHDFLESHDGVYWIGTEKGLCRFNPDFPLQAVGTGQNMAQRFVVHPLGEIASANSINMLYEDHAGTIWCGTEGGLFRLDQINGQWVSSYVDIIRPANSLMTLRVRALVEDRQGSLWISAESGLHRRRPDGTIELYTAKQGLPVQNALLEDRNGRLWAATHWGLYQLIADPQPDHPIVAERYTVKDGLASDSVTSLCQSANGKLWIGTNTGLSELLPMQKKLQSYLEENGLNNTGITTFAQDHYGNLWIGTAYGGAMRLAARGFTTYNQADHLGGINVGEIFEDRESQLCVAFDEGKLAQFNGSKFIPTRLSLPQGLTYWGWGWYQTLFQDSQGDWWVNTGQGLLRYARESSLLELKNKRPKAIYTVKDGLPSNEIFRLYEDSHGDIWISTIGDAQGTLTRWERTTERFHRYPPADNLPNIAPTAFCEDAQGNLWIGFYTGGLVRYSQGRFTFFTNAEGVPQGFIRGIYRDHSGRLWVATTEGGVARIDHPDSEHPDFIIYTTANGLSSNAAICVTEDLFGMIYIGTGRGLDKLDPTTNLIKHYIIADGLANSFINIGFRAHDGSLWFGTPEGLSHIIPQPEPSTTPPPILINEFRIAGVPYPTSDLGATTLSGPELSASQNHIQIDFVGLSLNVAETLRYQFKLEGTNGDWSAPTVQRSVNYPNLPPGSYRFLVRAVSADGTLSQMPAAVTFRILPALWQRWWFVSIALILLALPVILVARSRYQRMKAVREAEEALQKSREERFLELEQVRRRIATDLHDDIGSSLSQVYLLSEIVRQRVGNDNATVAEPLDMISASTNEMVSSMSDIVWAINPQKDHLSDLLHRMRRFASDTLSARDIAFQFRAPDDQADIRLGANIRREVFLIFKESVNNLVKHSGCSEAEIEFRVAGDALWLKVSDNGKGFSTNLDSDGHGLLSMQERAGSLGGQFSIVSTPGQGTTITLHVQLAQTAPTNTGRDGTI